MFFWIFALLNQILNGSVNKNEWNFLFLFHTWNAQLNCCDLVLFRGFFGGWWWGVAFETIIANIITENRISQPVWRPTNKWVYFWRGKKKMGIGFYRSYFKFTRAFARSTSLILGLKVQNIFVKAFQCVKQQRESASHRLGAGGWICG